MLIEFSVKNFRSFKEKQTFNMVSTISKDSQEHFVTGFNAAPNLLSSAAIFGPNASGKSNFLNALRFFKNFVISSSKDSQKGEPIERAVPFLFSEKTIEKPCEFEIVFFYKDKIYQYGFSVDRTRIHEEWLYVTNKGSTRQRAQRLLERDPENILNSYINPNLRGEREKWKELTRENALLLSTAIQLNSTSLEDPFEWIQNHLRIIHGDADSVRGFTLACLKEPEKRAAILKFVRDFDIAIEDIAVSEVDLDHDKLLSFFSNELKAELLKGVKELKDNKRLEVQFIHKSENGKGFPLEFSQESDGTKKLFSLAGPILDVLDKGFTLIIDELNNSLHPFAVRALVALFKNKDINKSNAQLIFTSHDTGIMNSFERDQIWKLDRNDFGASKLTPLSDYDGRPGDQHEKRYYSGRYGGLPSIGEII